MTNATSKLGNLPYFTDQYGAPLDLGQIYIGQPNTDPRQNPMTVYWDEAQTTPAAQPLATLNGFVARAGTVAEVFVNPPYSIYVQDSRGQQLMYLANVDDPIVSTVGALTAPVIVNVAALRLVDATKNATVTVLSYFSTTGVPDGGGGLYRYDATDTTTPDNGGTVIVGLNNARWKLMLTHSVSVKQFGAKGDGVNDDTAAIQACINSGQRRIYFPSGTYLITNTLNCTNLAETGVPLHIFGDAMQHDHGNTTAGTIVLCRTAGTHSGWIADFTGSQFCTVEDMLFTASGANASNKGLLFARSTVANFAQNNCLRRVMVLLPSLIGASVVGSIAVANNCAEEFVMDECWLQADTPFLSTLSNEVALASPFATIANTTFSNTKYSVRGTTFQPILFSGIIAYGLAGANFDNCTIVPQTPYTYAHAITLRASAAGYGVCANIKFTGDIESFGAVLRMEGNTENIEVACNTSAVNADNVSIVAGTTHQNFRYRPTPLNGATQNIILSTGSSVTLYGGEIVMPQGMKLVDPNLLLGGTLIDGGNNDLSAGANFAPASGSSYRTRWVNDYTHYAVTVNPGGVTTGGSVTLTVPAAGVRLTDKVTFAAPYDLSNLLVTVGVSSPGNIRVTVGNLSGGTLTLGSGTWRFFVERPTF